MRRPPRTCASLAGLLCLVPTAPRAHSFGTPYLLPIPLWMYAFGCAAALVLTCAVLGCVGSVPVASTEAQLRELNAGPLNRLVCRWGLWLLRAGALGCLLLTILAGLIGSTDPNRNVAMPLFWIVFLQGLTYLTLLGGDLYALINPWKWTVGGLERIGFDLSNARVRYPPRFGYWPALVVYVALIWMELFVGPKPVALTIALLSYTAMTFAGVALFGKATWFFHADFFGVFFRLIGKLAPIEYRPAPNERSWQVQLRPPFVCALNDRPEHLSLVLFVLFMLSSTTYDGIHDTTLWVAFFWRNLLWLLQWVWGGDVGRAQSMLMSWYLAYRQVGLLLFPLLYLGFYLLALLAAKALTRTIIPLHVLALIFCYSLIPIALAYNFTHYYTLLITEGSQLLWRFSDPFGFGWHLLTVAQPPPRPALQMGVVWHTQVTVLLAGHLLSVYLAHTVATQTFPTQRQVVLSQLPLLILMIAYTTAGLWILSLPLGSIG
jgi:hypothetical protein